MRSTDTLDRQTSVKKLREFSHHWNTQINQWKAAGLTNVEKQYVQPFWTDFLACFGINARACYGLRRCGIPEHSRSVQLLTLPEGVVLLSWGIAVLNVWILLSAALL